MAWRVAVVVMMLLGATVCGQTPPPAPAPAPPPPPPATTQAAALLTALLANLVHHNASTTFFLPSTATSPPAPASYWAEARALSAVLDGIALLGPARGEEAQPALVAELKTVAAAVLARHAAAGFGRPFYDDMTWMCMALLQAEQLLPAPPGWRYGDAAAALFATVMAGWDTSCCGRAPTGGVWWDTAHTQKATASNAGPVVVALELLRRTGDQGYAAFADRTFAYWLARMLDPSSGQLADHLTADGTTVWWRFTYNEGLMIRAALAMDAALGSSPLLPVAQLMAAFQAANETAPSALGPVLSDGSRSACSGDDCPLFKGVAVGALAELAAAVRASNASAPNPAAQLLGVSAQAVWALARDPATNLASADWAGPPPAPASPVLLGEQVAAVQALTSLAAWQQGVLNRK